MELQAGNRVVEVKQHYAPKISNKVAHKEQPSATERSALGFCQCNIQETSFERVVLYWELSDFQNRNYGGNAMVGPVYDKLSLQKYYWKPDCSIWVLSIDI